MKRTKRRVVVRTAGHMATFGHRSGHPIVPILARDCPPLTGTIRPVISGHIPSPPGSHGQKIWMRARSAAKNGHANTSRSTARARLPRTGATSSGSPCHVRRASRSSPRLARDGVCYTPSKPSKNEVRPQRVSCIPEALSPVMRSRSRARAARPPVMYTQWWYLSALSRAAKRIPEEGGCDPR